MCYGITWVCFYFLSCSSIINHFIIENKSFIVQSKPSPVYMYYSIYSLCDDTPDSVIKSNFVCFSNLIKKRSTTLLLLDDIRTSNAFSCVLVQQASVKHDVGLVSRYFPWYEHMNIRNMPLHRQWGVCTYRLYLSCSFQGPFSEVLRPAHILVESVKACWSSKFSEVSFTKTFSFRCCCIVQSTFFSKDNSRMACRHGGLLETIVRSSDSEHLHSLTLV